MCNENQTDFFQELFESRWTKNLSIVISGFMTTAGLFLIQSVIWYEHYGSDDKRTLQVRIFTSLLSQLYIFMFFSGIVSVNLC